MLDMGFIHDINRIVDMLPAGRQTLMFSATMPSAIRKFADRLLDDPASVEVAPQSTTADRIEQVVYHVDRGNKSALLKHLIETTSISRAIVFTRTKHGADKVVRNLRRDGTAAEAIHGNKSQNARQKALDGFRSGRVHVLVATDVAARGIDVDDISHVINYDLSHDPESYIHRIGRTARAGAAGVAISFCDREERAYLNAIQRLIRADLTVCKDQPAYAAREAHDRDADEDRDERPRQSNRGHHGGHRAEGRGKPSRSQGGKASFGSSGSPGKGAASKGAATTSATAITATAKPRGRRNGGPQARPQA